MPVNASSPLRQEIDPASIVEPVTHVVQTGADTAPSTKGFAPACEKGEEDADAHDEQEATTCWLDADEAWLEDGATIRLRQLAIGHGHHQPSPCRTCLGLPPHSRCALTSIQHDSLAPVPNHSAHCSPDCRPPSPQRPFHSLSPRPLSREPHPEERRSIAVPPQSTLGTLPSPIPID